jgi:hypothetical protein
MAGLEVSSDSALYRTYLPSAGITRRVMLLPDGWQPTSGVARDYSSPAIPCSVRWPAARRSRIRRRSVRISSVI